MPYTPQLGIGSTLTLGGTQMYVIDMRCQLQREAIDVTTVSDLYSVSVAGRLSGRITATVAVDKLVTDAVMAGFQGQTGLGTAVAFSFTDAGATNNYTGSAIILSAEHTISGSERDTLAIELQTTGQIT